MAEYNMQCPMAAKRLIYSGLPATVEHGKPKCAPSLDCGGCEVTDTAQRQ